MAVSKHRPVARARRVLLVVMGLLLAAIVGLYLFGRAGQQEIPGGTDTTPGETPQGEITLVGEDFEFTHSEGEKPIFRIRGRSVRADRSGTVYLEGVGLTLYDGQGAGYEISGTSASFNRETRQADLDGEVELRGPDNASLTTAGLDLAQRGRMLESTGPVRFTYLQLTGRADRMRIDRERDVYILAGNVEVDSLPDAEVRASLRAKRVVFERNGHLLRAEGDVVIERDGDRIEAALVNAFMDDANESFLFLRARWSVLGRMQVPGDGGRVIRFRGRSLAVLRDVAGLPQTAELEGTPTLPAALESPSPATADRPATVQRIVAGYILADFANGTIASVRAFNQPQLVEVDPSLEGEAGELRRLEGGRMLAGFAADGELVRLTADEQVRFRDSEVTASGDRAVYDVPADKAEFFGQPVRLNGQRGELLAPKVSYERAIGLIFAQEGVRALAEQAEDVGFGGTPLSEGDGPVRIESKEALWRDTPRSALFRGDVRAWRGENLLLAQAVRADEVEGGEKLVASGSVRTVWIPAPADDGEAAADGPVEVTANTLTYQRAATPGDDRMIYEGRVRAEQAERDLSCRRLEIELTEEGEAESLTCIGDAVLNDRRAGNSARGRRALYDLTSRTVTMLGEPVTLNKNDGAQVQGARVVYDLATGTARVLSEPRPAAAETPAGDGEGSG